MAEQIPLLGEGHSRPRADGAGDGWAEAHRTELGSGFNMNDVDGLIGHIAFARNTAERLFLEYVPDEYENRLHAIRRFALVALFDRKRSRDYALSEGNVLSRALYLWIARVVGSRQPVKPRFFYVVGGNEPPWEMIEVDITGGNEIPPARFIVRPTDWRPLWDAVGLTAMRQELSRWLHRAGQLPPAEAGGL